MRRFAIFFGILGALFSFPVASTTLWEQMQYPAWQEVELKALQGSGLSEATERLVIESCKRDLEEVQSYHLQFGRSSAHLREVSKRNQIRSECFGKVGETWCQQAAMADFMNQCASKMLAEAKLQTELSQWAK